MTEALKDTSKDAPTQGPTRRDARASALMALLVLAALFVAINLFADVALRGTQLDLTEDRLYTLTQGTRNILHDLDPDEPVHLTLFYSETQARGIPQLQAYAQRVREVLEGYALESRGGLVFEEVNPEAFSVGEERAQRAGIPPIEIAAGQDFYFGIEGVDSTDRRETIPFLDPSDESFLEFELTRLVFTLANPRRPVIGLMTDLPMRGGMPAPGTQQPSEPWQVVQQLEANYEVRTINPDDKELDDDLDLLLIVHAKQVGPTMQRLVDRYVMRGGPTVIFEDPFCAADMPPGADQNPMMALQAMRTSNLNGLTSAWGVEMAEEQIAGDVIAAVPVNTPDGAVPLIVFLALRDGFDFDDPSTRDISLLQLAWAGSLVHNAGAGTTWTPLVQTSSQSMLVAQTDAGLFAQPRELLANFVSRGEPLTVAGRLSGHAKSAFADVPQPEPVEGEEEPPLIEGPAEGDINVVIVSDADMLEDGSWIRVMRLGANGPVLGYNKMANNGDFLFNIVDQMAGSEDLIGLRARGTFARPFTRVEEIRRAAEQRYAQRREELETRRRETEQKLAELQRSRPDQQGFILTPEQQDELDRFRADLLETTRQLREVQYGLNKDVEALGTKLKVINIGAAPAAVALAALGLGAYRVGRRRADRRAARDRE